jgi:hypothetical protein
MPCALACHWAGRSKGGGAIESDAAKTGRHCGIEFKPDKWSGR